MTVGGTSLQIDPTTGAYGGETAWDGSSGGYSNFEPEPAYQQFVQVTRARSVPDVAYNGDPNTGFAIYDSVADEQGFSGWEVVGGTSAGTPQWARSWRSPTRAAPWPGRPRSTGRPRRSRSFTAFTTPRIRPASPNYPLYFNDLPARRLRHHHRPGQPEGARRNQRDGGGEVHRHRPPGSGRVRRDGTGSGSREPPARRQGHRRSHREGPPGGSGSTPHPDTDTNADSDSDSHPDDAITSVAGEGGVRRRRCRRA